MQHSSTSDQTLGGRGVSGARRGSEGALSCAFFLSGAAALVFEVVWFHRAGLVFGSTVWSTSLVLASFMAGLGAGNALAARYGHRIDRPARVYAALEVIAGASALALTYVLPHITALLVPVTRALADNRGLLQFVHFAAAWSALAVPAAAMGATLPVLVGALCGSRAQSLGDALGRLYGWNTLGAVAGVLAAELVLIPSIGITGSAWIAAFGNLAAAALAISMSERSTVSPQISGTAVRSVSALGAGSAWLLGCAALGGAVLMALEVVWFRFVSMFVLNSTLAVSMMLAVVLSAIGLGGLAASRWVRRQPQAWVHLPAVAVQQACFLVASYYVFQFATGGSLVAEWSRVLWFTFVLSFVPAFLSGVLFTLLGEALGRREKTGATAAAWLTLANTVGATFGPLLATFVLLPRLGMERALFGLATLYCVAAGLALPVTFRALTPGTKRTLALSAAAALVVLALFPFGVMSTVYFRRAAQPYTSDGSRVVATRESATETIFLMEQSWLGKPVYHRLVTNGFSMSGTHPAGRRYMRAFAYWPMWLHHAPLKRALVVCYGVGVTAQAVTDIESLESIDVVEISRDVAAMSDLIYQPREHPLHDPRVRLHIDDGRQFLLASSERFDMITGEPPPPLTPGTVNLYTREYFQLIYDRLAEGGIATYWLPIPRSGEYAVAPIIRAYCDVFPDCTVWNGSLFDWMLVGTRNASVPVSYAQRAQAWQHPSIGPRLREVGYEVPQQIGATFMRDGADLTALTAGAEPLTDNYPRRLQQKSADLDRRLPQAFGELVDAARAREAFERSPFIRRIWPDASAAEMAPFFDDQRVINRVMLEGANPLRHIDELHSLLVRTTLRRLPLWALGSNDTLQQIADTGNDGTGMVEYQLGKRLLVARNYAAAARYFAESARRGLREPAVRPLEVFALCLAGSLDEARDRSPSTRPTDPDERQFWQWMRANFGVGPAPD